MWVAKTTLSGALRAFGFFFAWMACQHQLASVYGRPVSPTQPCQELPNKTWSSSESMERSNKIWREILALYPTALFAINFACWSNQNTPFWPKAYSNVFTFLQFNSIQFFISFHTEQYNFILFSELSMSLINCTAKHIYIRDSTLVVS